MARTPIHPGEHLAEELKGLSISAAELSRQIDVSLYRATQARQDGPDMPRDYGWDRLLQSPVRTYDVEADHFSILDKVQIQGVASAFDSSIERAANVPAFVGPPEA